jgi:hypothetical protein
MLDFPSELLLHVFTYLPADDIPSLDLICKGISSICTDLDFWKFLVDRDFPEPHQKHLKDIAERNLKSEQAPQVITSLTTQFDEIRKTAKILLDQIEELGNIPGLSSGDGGTFGDIVSNLEEDLDTFHYIETYTAEYNDNLLDEPLKDVVQTQPKDFYMVEWEKSRIVPCEYVFTRGMHKGRKCGKPSERKTVFCKGCSTKVGVNKSNMAYLPPILPHGIPQNSSFPPNLPPEIPSLPPKLPPYVPEIPQIPLSPPKLPPYCRSISVRQLEINRYVTVEKPCIVFEYIENQFNVLGVNDNGLIRPLTDDEKIIAKDMGF